MTGTAILLLAVSGLVAMLLGKVMHMSAQIDALAVQVGDLEVAAQAVVTALKASTDPAAVDALSTRVKAVTDSLKAAVPPTP